MAATLNFHFREHWRDLKRGRPGRRFQDRYERARFQDAKCGAGQRIALVAAALVCLVIGVVLSVMPGPAVLFFFVAGGLLATESRVVAKVMDWSEVQVRNLLAWAKRWWRRSSGLGRAVVIVIAAGCVIGAAYASYRFMLG